MINKRRLLMVTPEYPPENWGGLSRTVKKVSVHAARMGFETHVAHLKVVRDRTPLFDENRTSERIYLKEENREIIVHRIDVGKEDFSETKRDLWDCPHTMTLRMMFQSLEKLREEYDFDLLHSFFLYPVGYVTGMIAARFNIPHVTTLVGNDVKKYMFSPEKVAVCKQGLMNSDRVVALSNDLMDIAHALAPVWEKGAIIYNSVDIPQGRWSQKPKDPGGLKTGCAGIFKYAKGLPYLLKAAHILRKRGEPIRVELLGSLRPAEEKVLERMAAGLGLEALPEIRGPIPHEEIYSWLMDLDAFVMPSVSEGCPNILMEALAAGLPCVATRTGAAEELIHDGVSGLLVPWGDSSAIADALQRIAKDDGLAISMGDQARKRMELFSPQREYEAWMKVYSGMTGKE